MQYRHYLLLSSQMEDSSNSEKDALKVSVPPLLLSVWIQKLVDVPSDLSLTTPIKRDVNNLFPLSQF